MPITCLINRDIPFISPSAEIKSAIGQLSQWGALIVQEAEATSMPAGVLTLAEINFENGNYVSDYCCTKPVAYVGDSWAAMLSLLNKTSADVLLLMNDNRFEGLIWKKDLLAFLRSPYSIYKRINGSSYAAKNPVFHQNKTGANEKMLRALYNNSSAVRLLLAPDYSILYMNRATEEKSYLFHNDQIKEGDNILEYIHDRFEEWNHGFTVHFENMIELARSGENVIKEIPLKFFMEPWKEIILWFRIACSAIWDEHSLLGISVAVTDINEKKKHELFIQNQNRILTEIIYTQSHEVRGPLSNILGIIELIETQPSAGSDPEVICWLKTSAKKLDEMIADVVNKAGQWRKPG